MKVGNYRRVRVTASARRESVAGNRDVTSIPRWQHPFRIEDPNWHRSEQLHRECEWKQGDSAVGEYGKDMQMRPPVGRRSPFSVARPESQNLSWEGKA